MNKTEQLKRIEKIELELSELKAEYNKRVKGWTPPKGKCIINGDGSITESYSNNTTYTRQGTTYKEPKAAEKHAKLQKLQNWIYQLALELNEEWKPSWDDDTQRKYYIIYDCKNSIIDVNSNIFLKTLGVSYFKDKKTAKKAIEIMKTWDLDK